jgi:hypothetical protein
MDDIRKMFEEERQQELDKANNNKQKGVKLNDDPRFVKWVAGKTYRMRLLFVPGPVRKKAFINKFTHVDYDADTKDYQWVTCPTSEYVDDKKGFDICPICIENNEIYKNIATSPSCKEMYDRMKRQFYGFALAYIVSDPVTSINNGTVKIIKYGVGMRKYFKKEIYGIDEDAWKKAKEEEKNPDKVKEDVKDEVEEIVGFGAFDTANGFDLLVSVSVKSDDYKSYSCKFSRTATAVPISQEEIAKQVSELNFDKDFYTTSTKTEILKLYNRFMAGSEVEGTNGMEQMDVTESIVAEKKAEQPVKTVQVPVEEKKTVPPPAPVSAPAGELNIGDIDAIIAEVTKK